MEPIPDEHASNRGAARPMIVRIIGSILLLAVVAFLWWRYGSLTPRNDSRHTIIATGTIEATEVDVSAEAGGRIVELTVDEGRSIKQGELIAQLERTASPRTCPHGRPTMVHLSSGRLEKEFGRT